MFTRRARAAAAASEDLNREPVECYPSDDFIGPVLESDWDVADPDEDGDTEDACGLEVVQWGKDAHAAAAKKRRRPREPERANLMDEEEVNAMTTTQMRACYEEMFGVTTTSGNQAWIFSKITGYPASLYRGNRSRAARTIVLNE